MFYSRNYDYREYRNKHRNYYDCTVFGIEFIFLN
jgi:hypothetical protein